MENPERRDVKDARRRTLLQSFFAEFAQRARENTVSQGEYPMKPNVMLTIASLLSIIFVTLHMADDIARGMEPGTISSLIVVPILVIWLYATLVLFERPSGYVIILLGSLLGLVVPVVHMKGAGISAAIIKSSGGFFFVWTLLALGVTSLFSVILSVRGLWLLLTRRSAGQQKQGAHA
jgi:hypothetical protein